MNDIVDGLGLLALSAVAALAQIGIEQLLTLI